MLERRKKRWFLSQLQLIALGFVIMILVGAVLLTLPISSKEGHWTAFLPALFTATSASCVTGLVVVDTQTYWSHFGQVVILILIQIGGLGFISIGYFFSIMLRKKIDLRGRGLLQESTNSLQIGGIVKLLRKIILGTALIEGSGALLLSIRFVPVFGLVKGIWYGIFHSISAFCNAGFDLMGSHSGPYSSLISFGEDPLINIVIGLLIVLGGIGFMVWDDVTRKRWHFKRYRLHTKMVLTFTFVLLFGGGILFFITESRHAFLGMDFQGKVLASWFASVTTRTAGFNSTDMGAYSPAGKFLSCILMFIGGSPGSTAGGIKTTTLLVLLLHVKAYISRSPSINIFGRRIGEEGVRTAASIATLNLTLVLTATYILAVIEPASMIDILVETTSAMGTVGMTVGITRDLHSISKIVLILLMYFGRVGSLSFAMGFTQNVKVAKVRLPKEEISVG